MSLGLPLIAWGSAEAIASSPWANIGTPVVTAGQTDPFGGTDAVLIEDDTAAANEGRALSLGVYGRSEMFVAVCARAGTATASDFRLFDSTATAQTHGLLWTWSGGVPSIALQSGSGTLYGTISLGGGWYLALARFTGITAGNVQVLRCFGARAFTSAAVGSTYWYLRNCVLLDYLDDPLAFSTPRQGQWATSASGVPDSWIPGTDYRLKARARWVPTLAQSTPVVVSGWDGRNESIGVNCGVQAMLRAGKDAQTLRFVPDRSACTTYVDSYLVEPQTTAPTLEVTGGPYRTFPLELRNPSTPYEGVP